MQLSAYYKLLQENEEKIPLIDIITTYHPGMGTDLGWSSYVGGMKDTGEWHIEKLLLESKQRLETQIMIWEADKKRILQIQDKIALMTPEERKKELDKAMEEWHRNVEYKLMWGK